ncbi:hypothetical protein I7I51_00589 [Histoplasma capsulatum]|uniref:Uncharacterized protein n=1 Tax=Ajellomyces capsulatus TaxID=5037 RepID=A0A8A1MC43_AJECA|nr:hypothetical protein I7I51_00589 [Histoplasma capsulatum]
MQTPKPQQVRLGLSLQTSMWFNSIDGGSHSRQKYCRMVRIDAMPVSKGKLKRKIPYRSISWLKSMTVHSRLKHDFPSTGGHGRTASGTSSPAEHRSNPAEEIYLTIAIIYDARSSHCLRHVPRVQS